MRQGQQRLADLPEEAGPVPLEDVPPIEAFLAGLSTAWKEGEARPTARAVPKQKRGRRRPDPLADVTDQLREWFEAEPWRTSRQLLEKLQAEYPGRYRDHLLRTVQRRVKIWRQEKAHELVFGPQDSGDTMAEASDGAAPGATSAKVDTTGTAEADPISGDGTANDVDERLAIAGLMAAAATCRMPQAPEAGDRVIGEH